MTVNEFDARSRAATLPADLALAADRIVPLSAAQRSIWFAQQLAPDTAFSIAQYVDVDGDLDTGLFTAVGQQVAREFGAAMVRLIDPPAVDGHYGVGHGGGGQGGGGHGDDPTGAPVQVIDDSLRDEMTHLDLRGEPDPEAAARAWMDAEVRRPLDLYTDRLIESATLRLADRRWFWYTRVHHILLDGYGATTFTDRVAQVYSARILGTEVAPSRAGSLADLHAEDVKYRSSSRFERDREYWSRRLTDLPAPIRLGSPSSGAGPGAGTAAHSVGADLDEPLQRAVRDFCAANDVTVAAVAVAATALYLARMSGRDEVVLSLPVSARTNALLRRSGGMVSNVVPIRATIGADTTVAQFLAQITAELSGALRHQRFRFEDMTRSPDGSAGGRGFFGPAVNIMMFRGETRLGHSTGRGYVLSTGPTDDMAFTLYTGGGDLRIDIEANGAAYSAADAGAHHLRLCTVLAALVAASADTRVARLDVVTAEQRALLVPARGPVVATAEPVPDLLARVRASCPDATALISDETALRYDELAERVNRLARVFIAHGMGPDEQVAVLLPRGTNSVTATLAVFATGATLVPIDPALPDDRIAYLLDDSGAGFGVTGPGGRERLTALPGPSSTRWLQLDDAALIAEYRAVAPDAVTDTDRTRPLTTTDAAYLIYTSGSTGLPKGVVVSHRGLASFSAEQIRRYGLGSGSRTVHFASPSFDAAILELLLAFASGATLVVVPPGVYGGDELARILRSERITHLFLTPAALASVPPDDLPDLGTVIVGGEACPPDLVARWARERLMFNAYGPTEATVMSTLAGPLAPGGAAGERDVPIGAPITGTTAVVLDHRLLPVPIGATGELYLGGAGIAAGYHRRQSLTATRFVADPYGPPGAVMYRTGDLAAWRADGMLDYRGRADRQIKIRGFRIEPGEVDAAIAAVPGVGAALTEPRVVTGPHGGSRTVLVGYFTGTADPDQIRDRLRAVLPSHMLPSALVQLDEIPLTSSGKVDRDALPVPEIRAAPYEAPRTPDEEAVAAAFAGCVSAGRVGRDDDFFALGGDSLAATRLVAELAERFGTGVPVRWVFESPTVAALARRLADPVANRVPALRHNTSDDDDVPVSPQQKRMWIINRFDTDSTAFHIPFALRLRGALDVPALAAAVTDVLDRHEALRTVYPDSPEGPIQQVVPTARLYRLTAAIRTPETVAAESVTRRIEELAATGFDVSAQVPLTVTLLRVSATEHVLVCVVHHIAADGSSSAPLARDLAEAYTARCRGTAPGWVPLPVTYRDYTRWHHELMGNEADPDSVSAVQLRYWREQLDRLPDLPALPTDRPRRAVAGGRGGVVSSSLPTDVVERIRAVAVATGTTPFMVTHAALAVVLARLSGTTDIAVGTPVAGRGQRPLPDLVGMFAGTLVLRTEVRGEQSFAELLADVREVDLGAFENADIPFDRLVDLMRPRRSAAHHPLFQVGFSYQNIGLGHFTLDGLDVEVIEPELGVAKSDLHLTLVDDGGSGPMAVRWDFDRDLFDRSTIEHWHALWADVLAAALDTADTPVGDLAAGADGAGSVAGPVSGRDDRTLTGLLESAFAAYPDHEALWVDATSSALTYGQLHSRVTTLAHTLIAAGVGPETRVAVAVERSAELIEAVLAILVAGGAYVPVDPAAPTERNRLVLGSASPALVLVAGGVPDGLPCEGIPVCEIAAGHNVPDGEWTALTDADRRAPLRPSNTAYVIYTSGSTGTPKGVAVSHAAIAAQLRWKAEAFPLCTDDTLVLKTNLTFDLSVWELFWPLISGARLVLAAPGVQGDPRELAELMARTGTTAAHFVPSLLDAHLDALDDLRALAHQPLPPRLERVLCIGEALTPATAARAAQTLGARVFNLYGPTEAAVGITCHEWTADGPDSATVSIGVPVDDSAAVILDTRLHPVPAGVVGELYLGGVQLATAYEGRRDLTATRFVARPGGTGTRLYRTGDLARTRPDGQIEFLGRNDFQVKIRGRRIELGEIESALAADERVAAATVTAHGDLLTAYLVPFSPEGGWDADVVLRDLASRLPAYMVPGMAVTLRELPRGIHGKVDRGALPEPSRGGREYLAPRTATERALVDLLGDLLPGADTPQQLGIRDDFFDVGGNSLLAARLSARIEDVFGVRVSVRAVFDTPVVGDLARRIDDAHGTDRPRLTARQRPERIPLSRPQQRMWLLDQLDPGSAAYNLPLALRVDGPVEMTALTGALRYLLDRHESLRTIYPAVDGVPYQRILGTDEALTGADIVLNDAAAAAGSGAGDLTARIAEIAGGGFALDTRIPLRVHLIAQPDGQTIVVVVVHHIVADGWSVRLLFGDLIAGYLGAGGNARPLPVQYADYTLWRAELLGDTGPVHASIAHQHRFWRRTLADLPGPLPLPFDRSRPAHPTGRGATVEFEIGPARVAAAEAYARTRRATLFHVVHAAFAMMLSRLSGSTDIVIGTPVSGRPSVMLDDVVGMFAETVVLRTEVNPDSTVAEFIDAVRATDTAAQDNSEIPFDVVAAEFESDPGGAHHPVFQVMLAAGDPAPSPMAVDGVTVTPAPIDLPVARFDLHLTVDLPADSTAAASGTRPIRGRFTYATDLFDHETAAGFPAMLSHVLHAVTTGPGARLHDIDVVPEETRAAALAHWSAGPEPTVDRWAGTLPDILAANASRGLSATVCDDSITLTMPEFGRRVARTARALIDRGVGPESTVAVAVDRSVDMLVAVHAVVAAGGAYVPLDLGQPPARVGTMLEVVDPVVVIAQDRAAAVLPPCYADELFAPDAQHADRDDAVISDHDRLALLHPGHPAYVLFTSGSTGVPKAVAVSHEAIVNRLVWMQDQYPIGAADTVLQKTPITFDVSVWELFWPLISGASVVLAAPGAHRDPQALAVLIAERRISVVHFVPTMLDAFFGAPVDDADLTSLRLVFTSGEALGGPAAAAVLDRTDARLHNLYGPTEAAVDVTAQPVGRAELDRPSIPIGRPASGNQVYVLDRRLRPVVAGVIGELYLGGVQLARGYHGRRDLTSAHFIASPWDTGGRLYRTGDLVRWRRAPGANPVLEYLGRSDFQVKIRGQRVETGEIEAAILSHPGVTAAVTVAHDAGASGSQLMSYVVASEAVPVPSPADIRSHVALMLPDHMVPGHVMLLDALPVTTSGKVDRRALPTPATGRDVARGGSGADGRTATETALLAIIRPLLGNRFGVDDDFFDLGGNSLSAIRVAAGILTDLGVRVPVRAIFDARTVSALATVVEDLDAGRAAAGALPVADRPARLPLSAAQQQMWLHNRMFPASNAFMIVAPLRIPGRLDAAVLRQAVGDVIERHEILRTAYPETEHGPVQVVRNPHPGDLDPVLTVLDAVPADGPEDSGVGECVRVALHRPLDLVTDLPLRVVIRPSAEVTEVALAIHHIAADGWSLRVLADDLNLAYTARAAGTEPDWQPLPVRYADHMLARAARLGSATDPSSELAGHLEYWRATLGDAPVVTGPVRDGSGGATHTHRVPVDSALLAEIDRIAVRHNTTRFAVVHAALAVMLSRSGVGRDVLVGTPVAGRSDGDVAGLVGMFITMVALRSDVDPLRGFGDLVARSRETILDALDHSAVDVEEVIDHLGITRDGTRHPLIGVTLTVDTGEHPATTADAAALAESAARIDLPVARFDLEFSLVPAAGRGAELTVVHRPEAYSGATAATLLARLGHVLRTVAANPEVALRELDLVTVAEHAAAAALSGPIPAEPRFLHEVLSAPGYQVAGPDATGRWVRWDHHTFIAYSDRLARALRKRGARPEMVVALYMSRSVESVAAMRAVAMTGAAFVPIDPNYPADRIAFMFTDSGARIVVTTAADRERLSGVDVTVPAGAIDADDPDLHAATTPGGPGDPHVVRHIDQLAYLIYTSGSTGTPKAVAVTHRGIASFVAEQRRYGVDAGSRVVHFASPGFDAALLEILLAADAGATTVVAPTTLYGADDLVTLLRVEAVTHAFLTPGVLETITPARSAADPLPELGTLIVGGDACAPAVARRWICLGKRFFNAFGPTETTIMATLAGPLTDADTAPMLIGPGVTGALIQVLDESLSAQPAGVTGELYVAGPGLARGYHGRAALTAATFVADPDGPPGSRRYRTGDLVCAVTDHSGAPALTHQGRADRQVKIRGHRVETGEIETMLRAEPGVGGAVVTTATGPDGTAALVAYVVPAVPAAPDAGAPDAGALRTALRGRLPGYAVPASITVLGAIPLTTSGKVDQRALPAPVFGETGYVAPESILEHLVVQVFAEVLHRDRVGVHDNFFDAGGTSLSAATAVARLRSRAGRELSVPDLFEAPTAAGLATVLDRSATPVGPAPGELPRPDRIPLSPAQRRMWFLNRFDPSALTENIPLVLRITGDLDAVAFGAALHTLVMRHESLRTLYPDSADGPFQEILPVTDASIELPVTDVDQGSLHAAVRAVTSTGFDVTAEIPVRAALLRETGGGAHVFVLVLHHICADGLSVVTLAAQLADAYGALLSGREPDRTPAPVQYADFAVWQCARLDDPDGPAARELAQWRDRLDGAPPVIDLPTDRPRPAEPTGAGRRVEFPVGDELWARVTDFAGRRGVTPFMVAHTALAILLGRIGDNRDVVIGTPIAGRDQARLDGAVGMFVNMLALRTAIGPAATGEEALAEARAAALHGFAHSSVAFDRIVETLDLPRTTTHHPVFQVAFSFQNLGPVSMTLPGAEVEVIDDDLLIAEFDLHLTLAENYSAAGGSTGVTGQLVYATDLFDASTATDLTERYVRLLGGLVEFPDRPVGDLALLGPAELARLSTSAPSAQHTDTGLADAFHAQAQRTPDADAVVTADEVLSYRELARRVAGLADVIAGHGVGPDVRVAITAPRSLHQVIAMYAVAAVGAAYVPVDLTAGARATMILDAADPALVLGVGASQVGDLPYLDLTALPESATPRPAPRTRPDNSAYVLFTSGSTGVPKGVDVSVGAVTEQLRWMQQRYPMGERDTVVLKTSAGFDLSVWEYWWPLRTGARIVIAEPDTERDGRALLDSFARHRVTVLPTVPSGLAMVLDAGNDRLPGTLRTVLCIGEELPAELVTRFRSAAPDAVLHNLYGPTEAAVSVTGREVGEPVGRVPIGIPQPSVAIRVLDSRLGHVPDGVAGELYLSGVQVARGYHDDPARTALSFVADPVDGSRMYRTGDLVRRRRDGNLVYLGRTDHQLKIRGFRIEPGEIEAVLRQSTGVADAVVIAVSRDGGTPEGAAPDRLVGFITAATGSDPAGLAAAVSREVARRLPGYLRPEVHVLDDMPYNGNGKVDRSRLPQPEPAQRHHVAPSTDLERLVATAVAEVVGDTVRVGMTDNFFALGGNSLSATRLAARLEHDLHCQIPVRVFFDAVDVADIAARIAELTGTGGRTVPPLVRTGDGGPAPAAPAQRRLWESVRAGSGGDWNVPMAIRFTGGLDIGAVEAAVLDLVERHESLRTRFRDTPDGVRLIVVPTTTVAESLRGALTPFDIAEDALPTALAEAASIPLDVMNGVPIGLRLLRLRQDVHILVLVVHHLSFDGQSMAPLARDVLTAYTARRDGGVPELPEPEVTFADYARWRTGILGAPGARTDEFARQLGYWTGIFGDGAGALASWSSLPTDRARPAMWDAEGATVRFRIDEDLHTAVDDYARTRSVSVFAVLQAAFAVVLAERTGDTDVHVATSNGNRTHPALDGVVGNFSEEIPMRLDVSDPRPFVDVVRDVREQLLGGLAHPDISIPDLIDAFGLVRDDGGSVGHPVFSSTLILQQAEAGDAGVAEVDLGDVRIARETVPSTTARHDLEFTLLEIRDGDRQAGIEGTVIYPVALFDRTSIEPLAERLLEVLAAAMDSGDPTVGDVRDRR